MAAVVVSGTARCRGASWDQEGEDCCLKQISSDTVSVCQWKVGLLVKPSMHGWVRQGREAAPRCGRGVWPARTWA